MRACLLLLACAAAARPMKNYVPDPSLVSWESGLEGLEKLRFPFAAKYGDGRKRLVYVAGDHTSGDGPNLRTVKAMFDELKPQAVLVEGFRTKGDFDYREHDLAAFASGTESPYALHLAGKAGIAARGGEPFDADVLAAMRKKGFAADDVLGFFLARMIPGWRRDGEIPDEEALERKARAQLAGDAKELGLPARFGPRAFAAWYAKQGAERPPLAIEYADLRPYEGAGATRLQRIAFAVDQVREARFLEQLRGLLESYDRVLVTYGGSHLCRERRMLAALLGEPEDEKPF